jgi:hypothetical protein
LLLQSGLSAFGVTVRVLPKWGEIIVALDGVPSHKSFPLSRSLST